MNRPSGILDRCTRGNISAAYLPGRWYVHYVRSKLATDPLYKGVVQALADTDAPVLDLGCGIGLLPHCLAALGRPLPVYGLDNDAAKIDVARRAAENAGLVRASFECADLTQAGTIAGTGHCGSVVVLDLLQYLPPERRAPILEEALSCLARNGRFVMRTGLDGAGARMRLTRAADRLARALGWMNTEPRSYPSRDWLCDRFAAAGLVAEFQPLWGRTPFNNWLVTAHHPVTPVVGGSRSDSPVRAGA